MQLNVRKLIANPGAVLGFIIVSLVVLTACVGPIFTPYDPIEIDLTAKRESPSAAHLFGTDTMGRDVFSRVVHGTRYSIIAACVVVAIAVSLGSLIGSVSGYFGGIVDASLMRVTDIFLAFPFLILAMAIAAALGPSLVNAIFAVSVVRWPSYARLVRGMTLSLKEELFVEAARAMGCSSGSIIRRHILPNCAGPLLAQATTHFGFAILATTSLSFVGLGAQPPSPEWGAMISEGRTYIMSYWWIATFPGLAIALAVLGFSLFGDAIQEILPS